ncbi:hypothetical protein [Arthrobacter sp. CAN_C5]|uniref:hypothetical protein n=1 Tax=Arthrobacter sp. CAN_C5 TaxID=2760706 RepID=UPI001AE47C21|nr:hypothetical protein [Arthrobacter sp. CAN_C5]MBP2217558.1 hypothetical protein [Arthrobacter sp. CAN_C5]
MSTRRTETSPVGPSRHRNSGPGRLLIAVYGIFALAATARAVFQISTKFAEAPLAYLLTALAAGVYVLATVSLAMPGRRWYWISVGAVGLELVGVLTIGLFSLLDPEAFPNDTVWSLFGRGYGFVPLLLPVLGLWWLYLNRRGRAAEPATERASPTA